MSINSPEFTKFATDVWSDDFTPRTARQHIEGEMWIDDAVDFLIEIGVFTANEEADAREVAKKLLYFNKDEGGELMEVSAREYVRWYVRGILGD